MSDTKIGHNSNPRTVNNIAGDRLLNIVERVERLKGEQKSLSDDIKDIMTEAKSAGFDPKIIREIIRIRQQDALEREAREQLRDVYLRAIGMY
jgi:uncharacterized protein (UPF0335 family)